MRHNNFMNYYRANKHRSRSGNNITRDSRFSNRDSYKIPEESFSIYPLKAHILQTVKSHLWTFISSQTGSGKSTQIPQYLLEMRSKILCCEPRKIACNSICNFVISNAKSQNHIILNNEKQAFKQEDYDLLFVKENLLLEWFCQDSTWKNCDILIIDEIHERTQVLDLIWYFLKYYTIPARKGTRHSIRILFMSATFDINNIINYFKENSVIDDNDIGVIEPNENYKNYDIIYWQSKRGYYNNNPKRNNGGNNDNSNSSYNIGTKEIKNWNIEIVKIITKELFPNQHGCRYWVPYYAKPKSIMVFLPDYKSIYFWSMLLNKKFKKSVSVIQLTSSTNRNKNINNDIKNILFSNTVNSSSVYSVILTTTYAETCLTFPNCSVVIDTGLKKYRKFNYDNNWYDEYIHYISQDSAIQRAGRCGRNFRLRGKCYRWYDYNKYKNLLKYRVPEIELQNIDLLVLRVIFTREWSEIWNRVDQTGYWDVISKLSKSWIDLIINKLIDANAVNTISSENNYSHMEVTEFGHWLLKSQLDILIGKISYEMYKQNQVTKERISIISLLSQNQNCDWWYSHVDSHWFKLGFMYYEYNSDKANQELDNLSSMVSKNIIDCIIDPCKPIDYYSPLQKINRKYTYYKWFCIWDEVYNAKYFFTRNKIFQLGDWMISYFFLNQYTKILCQGHYNRIKFYNNDVCSGCKMAKFFYCAVYSWNEKFFNIQYSKKKNINSGWSMFMNWRDKRFPSEVNADEEEYNFAYWNMVYLNWISNNPTDYWSYDQVEYLSKKVKNVDFDCFLLKMFEKYRDFYIKFGRTLLCSLTANIFVRHTFKKYDKKIDLFFRYDYEDMPSDSVGSSKNNIKITKIQISKTFISNFYIHKNEIFFAWIKYTKDTNKSNSHNVLPESVYKNINPIFPEIILSQNNYFLNIDYIKTSNLLDTYSLNIETNIGKFFYFNYLKTKFSSITPEFTGNSLIFVYTNEDIQKEETQIIKKCIETERNNYINTIEELSCLRNDCLVLQMSQGWNILNKSDDNNPLNIIYEIQSNIIEDEYLDINEIENICEINNIPYKKLFTWQDKVMISFNGSSEASLFMRLISNYFDFDVIPYKANTDENTNEASNNNKLFCVTFDKYLHNGDISRHMREYLRSFYNNENSINNFKIVENILNKKVYYYLNTNISNNNTNIWGLEIARKHTFHIKQKMYQSSQSFEYDFSTYCREKRIQILQIPYYNNLYEIENYTKEANNHINRYLKELEIQWNPFAFHELKLCSKDTFLYNTQYSSWKQYGFGNKCFIDFIFFEYKIVVYGAPENKQIVKTQLSQYLEGINKEKIILVLSPEQTLMVNFVCREMLKQNIALRIISTTKIEFRKQYWSAIKEILGKPVENYLITEHGYYKYNKDNSDWCLNTCEICLENILEYQQDASENPDLNDGNICNNYIELRLCGHSYCIECLKMQITTQINDANNIPIRCIKCNNVIANSDIKEIFSLKEMEKISYKWIKIFMQVQSKNKGRSRYHWCKTPNCDYIYTKDNYNVTQITFRICPNCDRKYCWWCDDEIKNGYHNVTCRKKLMKKINVLDRKWLMNNTRNCPWCNNLYEKSAGCNHMTCTFCRPQTEFCYICGMQLDNGNPWRHFSEKGSKCYNRWYEEVAPRNEEIVEDQEEEEDVKSFNDKESSVSLEKDENENKKEIWFDDGVEKEILDDNNMKNEEMRNYIYGKMGSEAKGNNSRAKDKKISRFNIESYFFEDDIKPKRKTQKEETIKNISYDSEDSFERRFNYIPSKNNKKNDKVTVTKKVKPSTKVKTKLKSQVKIKEKEKTVDIDKYFF